MAPLVELYLGIFWAPQWPRKLIRNNPLKPWDVRFVISMKGGSWLWRHQVGGSHVVFYCQYIVYHLLLARILPLSRPKSFQHSLNKVGPSCYLATILHNDSTALSRTFQQCCHFTRRIGLGNAWKLHQKKTDQHDMTNSWKFQQKNQTTHCSQAKGRNWLIAFPL